MKIMKIVKSAFCYYTSAMSAIGLEILYYFHSYVRVTETTSSSEQVENRWK